MARDLLRRIPRFLSNYKRGRTKKQVAEYFMISPEYAGMLLHELVGFGDVRVQRNGRINVYFGD
jgi:hypothetical protein